MIITIKEGRVIGVKDWRYNISPVDDDRTIAQNKLYWKWLEILSIETGNDKNTLHKYMKSKFLSEVGSLKFHDRPLEFTFIDSTKDLSKKQFTEYLEKVFLFISDLGIEIPSLEFISLSNKIDN